MIFGEFDAHPEFLHFRCPGHNCIGLPNGWGRDKAGRDHPAGLLIFPACSNMLCIIPPGSNECARAALCRLESCFYAGGHWGVCFCKRGSVSSSERAFARSALRCRFGCLFHCCSGICSVLFSQIRPVVQGVFLRVVLLRVFTAFLGVRGFREGQDRRELIP